MSALAKQLKDEISRSANRHVRQSLTAMKRSLAQQRKENATLKRRVSAMERALMQLAKGAGVEASAPSKGGRKKVRFSASGFASLRKKLGINAAQTAALLGVSDQSVYKWEQGKVRPRAAQLEGIVALRKTGKRAVHKRLAELAQAQ